MEKVLVGLSGGVDSSVAAALMVGAGHEVVGAYMKNWVNDGGIPGDCPWERDVEDARAVAEKLGIEFRVIDMIDTYRQRIVDYLLEGYRAGITPNPDVLCNREMKFGVFLDYALGQGLNAVATGHYVRRRVLANGDCVVLRGADPNKDQSYFLALMTGRQVARARFPVGEMLKPQVRETALRFGLPTAEKKDSQGICFIGRIKMVDFLRHHLPDKPGEIVDTEGRVLGCHQGLHLYTLGQRRGHGVASSREGMAYVVVGKDVERNRLVLGWDKRDTPGLYASHCVVGSISLIQDHSGLPERAEAQPRYRAKAERVRLARLGDGRYDVVFDRPQRAVAPGQICAFYDGGKLLGGGVFEEILG